MPKRALLRQPNGPPKPRASGSLFSSGTNTLSITTSPVHEARKESLFLSFGVVRPSMPRSRMKPRMTSSSSFAHTTNTSASGALEIHILAPLRR